jgi:hypothetical protein
MDHELLNDPGQSIPGTSCDNGSCTEKQASLWNSSLTYGFGMRCDNIIGTFCQDDFIEKNAFRPLGQSLTNTMVPIASGIVEDKAYFSLSYKLIVSGTQPKGSYAATASYLLIPGI